AGGEFGNITSPRTDATRLERRRGERIEINRVARGFVESVHAGLHAAGETSAAAKGRCRSWRAGAAGGESRAATQSASCSRTETANLSGRGADRAGIDQSRPQLRRRRARNERSGGDSVA